MFKNPLLKYADLITTTLTIAINDIKNNIAPTNDGKPRIFGKKASIKGQIGVNTVKVTSE